MKRKTSNNPEGRPKEYEATMRLVSVSLPEPLIEVLDEIAANAGISRQRLVVETLLLAVTMNRSGYVWSDAEGTHFNGPHNKTNLCETPSLAPTHAEIAAHYAKLAKMAPDMRNLPGMAFTILRDTVLRSPEDLPPEFNWDPASLAE